MKNIKPKSLIISACVAIVVFIALLFVEKSLLKPNGTVEGFVAVSDIDKGMVITEENISKLFTEKNNIDGALEVTGAVKTKDELINKVAKENINKGEVVSNNSFISKDDKFKDIDDLVEVSFNVSDISQVVGGILRSGDIIDISIIDNNTNESMIVLEDIYVDKAISSDGLQIDRSSDLSALTINILVSKDDSEKLNSYLNKGTLRISKNI
ncbi:MAG: SAF domain-containing protein [Clostridium sp.]|uniref:SAF domain-containing protein n=1 Tax=Clostridium TaxID=1485 RepID=UPI000C076536|nr:MULTISPECIES: SAF domain-containing protein [Clostridium]MDB2121135.1 SAF domain-containing protein [Clostridium paraputrificum]MDU2754537.1 SAF domain-containing protein [Clostridium sp.]MDU2900472.1 SAF domain-containing protein [Clostridium sp.]MDU4428213.1 SAF domain-containing protein [Clostridium sp.]MDU7460886.1 SAF domain-containing protein [Clostridium sp.]